MSITHDTLTVEGVPFTRILDLQILHRPNTHGRITIIGEMSPEDAADYVQRADETSRIVVKSKAEEQEEQILFSGALLAPSISNEAEYTILRIEGITTSYYQDIKKFCRSFQNSGKSYEEILNQAFLCADKSNTSSENAGQVDVTATDRAIGPLIVQMDETNWEFARRMASRLNIPIFASIKTPQPLVFVGLPPTENEKTLKTTAFYHAKQDDDYNDVTQNYMEDDSAVLRQDFSSIYAESYEYVYLGDTITLNDTTYYVKGVEASLADGLLRMRYELAGKSGFVAPMVKNTACSGRILIGRVQAVQQDMVQVHLVEIDEAYDGGDWWFPYSTAYSSSDGSGWYVMPEIGDYVRIMFPSKDEAGAFAASSINKSPLANPRHKSFKAPSGKELLMTDEGLYVICNHQKIFIDLMQDDGIRIVANKDIHVVSSANITVQAGKEVQILAKEQILLGTPKSFLILTPDKITLAAKEVVIT